MKNDDDDADDDDSEVDDDDYDNIDDAGDDDCDRSTRPIKAKSLSTIIEHYVENYD